jgi:hypothetical protein
LIDDSINEAIVQSLMSGEPPVAVRIASMRSSGCPGVKGDALGQHSLHIDDLFGLNRNVREA